MPVLDGELAGDEGRTAAVAVVENFKKIVPAGVVEGSESPIVEEEELSAGEAL